MYAECPNCHAIFRAPPELLSKADGRVRCGECATVFRINMPESPATEVSAPATRANTPEVLQPTENVPPPDPLPEEVFATPSEKMSADRQTEPSPLSRISIISTEDNALDESQTASLFAEQKPKSNDLAPGNSVANANDKQNSAANPAKPAKPNAPKDRRALVGFLGLLLIAVFFGQMLYKNHLHLAKYTTLRPAIQTICRLAKCTLPPQRDLAKLVLQNHGIYSHPNRANALMIKATIVNEASFEQPLPILELSLSNIRGEKLAMRRFAPSEYLAESNGDVVTVMQSGQPINLSLQIVDPGKDALAFAFEFR